jgi:hypothetical protein
MRTFLLFISFTFLLFANNPTVFSALGDVIYNNAPKIEKLKNVQGFKKYSFKINNYLDEVERAKQDGFALEKHHNNELRRNYLNELRALAKVNDFFNRMAYNVYDKAKEENNTTVFLSILDTGLINVEAHKKEIVEYYFMHRDDINSTGTVIEKLLNEDEKLREKKENEFKRKKSKKAKELERIRYLREKDKMQQERLQERLNKELKEKQEQIQEEQKEELSKTI